MSSEATKSIFEHGATWVRADFHLHTKADREFRYEGEEDWYNANYVAALETAGIRVGVITNHNKFVVDEYHALRKTAEKKGIVLLPGVELSVGDGANGIHVLVVFAPTWLENGQDRINPFLTSMFVGKIPSEYELENGRSDKSLLQTVEDLDKIGLDYFLIFAHVEDAKGLWCEVDGGRLSDWATLRYEAVRERTLAFQKVRTRDDRAKVQGWLKGWYPAEVEGSDPKSIDEIGKGKTVYLKLGSLDFDAVKFALFDHPRRLASEPPACRHGWIKGIRFQGGSLREASTTFSPELNTLIGIRGSGKSSILEAIRYAFDLTPAEDHEYKTKLVRNALGTSMEVSVDVRTEDGIDYEIRRQAGGRVEILQDGVIQPGISIQGTLFKRVTYFGQKDLASNGDSFEKGLIEKLMGDRLAAVRRDIELQKAKVKEVLQRSRNAQGIEEKIQATEQAIRDKEFKLDQFRKFGIEEKLQKQRDFGLDARRLSEMASATKAFDESLQSVLAEHQDRLWNLSQYASTHNGPFFQEVGLIFGKMLDHVKTLNEMSEAIRGEVLPALQRKDADFVLVKAGMQSEFTQAQRLIDESLRAEGREQIRPEEFLQLSTRLDQERLILTELRKEAERAQESDAALQAQLDALDGLLAQEFELVQEEVNLINAQKSALSVEALYRGDRDGFKVFLRDLLRGSGMQEVTYDKVLGAFKDCREIYRGLQRLDSVLGASAVKFRDQFERNLEAALLHQVSPSFRVLYKGKELKDHSTGQRASALILFVLGRQESEVILVDQPEDDLDNQTIYEDVIKLLLTLKPKTQFILATHNANFPVLGDAEMVLACGYASGQVRVQQGGIDDPSIQRKVVSILEGGKEAFNRRKEIYTAWNPRNS